jgi:hypothetical protein
LLLYQERWWTQKDKKMFLWKSLKFSSHFFLWGCVRSYVRLYAKRGFPPKKSRPSLFFHIELQCRMQTQSQQQELLFNVVESSDKAGRNRWWNEFQLVSCCNQSHVESTRALCFYREVCFRTNLDVQTKKAMIETSVEIR